MTASYSSSFLGQCERHVGIAGFGAQLASATCSDDHVLASVYAVRGGRCITGKRQRVLPQQLPRCAIECAKLFVGSGSDEHQAACGHDAAAEVRMPVDG